MASTYHGVETGVSAIRYTRKAMEISGMNTSKANKAGYTRQTVLTQASAALSNTPYSMSHLGTGVEITEIKRMRDMFLDARMRRASVDQAYWQTMSTGMERVDSMIIATSEKGLDKLLDNFWTAIQDVHIHPDEASIRGIFLQEADTLVKYASNLSSKYSMYRDELNDDIRAMVEEANALIDQIAIINKGISQVQLSGGEPNELLDKRDLMVDELCALTGATSTTSVDERDNDFKVIINGMLVVQGTKTRHLMLVPNEANNNYYEVQIEYNQYDITSDPSVAGVIIERRADDQRSVDGSCTMDATYDMEVLRMADELYWTVGYGASQTDGGSRMDGIATANTALGIEGSFALQVGSSGVRAYSEAYSADPPGVGVVLGEPGPDEPTEYSFRIAAGDFETTVTLKWDDAAVPASWTIEDNLGNTPAKSAGELKATDLVAFINANYSDEGLKAGHSDSANSYDIVLETTDRQLLAITDIKGTLMQESGLTSGNPIVKIEVTKDDTLQTIANKINNAYSFDTIVKIVGEGEDQTTERLLHYTTVPPDTAPNSPEEWMHASVEVDARGDYYLCLTSNVAGEANRINVMSGSVCGDDINDMTVARLLGLVENIEDDKGVVLQSDVTSYIQLDRANDEIITRYTEGGDVFVDDAYIIFNGKEYLSSGNEFKDARRIASIGEASADVLEEFSAGIRLFLNGVGTTTITVRHPLTDGEIFATIKLRDDVLLSHLDVFDDMMYKLATEFNAIHYAGYGTEDYKDITGMPFFEAITNKYGAFGELQVDDMLISEGKFDHSRLAAFSGDGNGKRLGEGDGSNALAIAQLKQAKIFMSGTTDFNGLYLNFVATYGSFGQRAANMLDNQDYIVEQIGVERSKMMDVNVDEEMLSLVQLNQNFNYASQYISTLMQVIDQIIGSLGRVGI